MKLVVDSNIVFSAMLNPKSSIGDIILNSQDSFVFCACEYLKEEINLHKSKILKISGYDELEYEELGQIFYERINFITESTIPFEYWKRAADLVREVDMDDISHVALSLFLDIKLWTGDKVLVAGLLRKGFTNVISTQEVLQFRRII
jgi:predicted nucleic acid-binding protein